MLFTCLLQERLKKLKAEELAELEGGEAEGDDGEGDDAAPAEKRAKRCKGKTESKGKCLGGDDGKKTSSKVDDCCILLSFCAGDEEVFEGLHAEIFCLRVGWCMMVSCWDGQMGVQVGFSECCQDALSMAHQLLQRKMDDF